jgi:hypothetical protein
MESQTSEAIDIGTRAAPQAIILGGQPEVRRKPFTVCRGRAIAAALEERATADSNGRIRRRSGVPRRRRSTIVRRCSSRSLRHSLLHRLDLRLKRSNLSDKTGLFDG